MTNLHHPAIDPQLDLPEHTQLCPHDAHLPAPLLLHPHTVLRPLTRRLPKHGEVTANRESTVFVRSESADETNSEGESWFEPHNEVISATRNVPKTSAPMRRTMAAVVARVYHHPGGAPSPIFTSIEEIV
ncbi:hypothetical protein GCM10027184_04800 [Saccharothrix stipae]